MGAKVVDASVVGSLLFGEPRAKEAELLLKGYELYAPPLLTYELTSIARKKIRQYSEQRETLKQALQIGLNLQINKVEPDHGFVLQLALESGLSTYDASYLYLAQALRLPLVTFDELLSSAYEKIDIG